MRNINVTVDTNGGVTVANATAPSSYSGEHNATRINVAFSDLSSSVFSGADYFRIVCNGRYSERLNISGEGFSYDIPQSVTVPPAVRCQISGYGESGEETVFIAKSAVFCFEVEVSEPGEYEIDPDPGLFISAMARCEDAARTVGEYADSASESATTAAGASALAEGYADAAASSAATAGSRCAEATAAAENAAESAESVTFIADTVTDAANAIHGHKTGSIIFADDVAKNNGGRGLSALLTEYGSSETTVVDGEDLYFENLRTFSPASELNVTVESPYGLADKGITVFVGTGDGASEWTPVEVSYSVNETGVVCTARFTVEDGMLLYDYELYYTGYGNSENRCGSAVIPTGAAIRGISGVDGDVSGGNTVTAKTVMTVYSPQTVTVTGRNLLPLYNEEPCTVLSDGGFTVKLKDGNIMLSGTLSGNIAATLSCFKTAFPLDLPAGTYYLSYCGERLSAPDCSVSVISTENNVSETVAEAHISSGDGLSPFCGFTAEEGKTYHFGINLSCPAGTPLLFSNAVLPVMIEKTYSGQYRPAMPVTAITVTENGTVSGAGDYHPEITAFISDGTLTFDYKVDTDIAYKRLAAAINALGGDVAL